MAAIGRVQPKFDVYQAITDKVIAQLEQGNVGKWEMPWHRNSDMPKNLRGTYYRGVNVPVLWFAAAEKGYDSPVWGTYNQWKEKGAQVRKGEHSTMVVLWKPFVLEPAKRKDQNDDGKRLMARAFYVFNQAQVDGYEPPANGPEPLPEADRVALAEAFFTELGADVAHGGERACYIPATDQIKMPAFSKFKSAEGYYATLGHEHVHWTGAEKRLDRPLMNRFGSDAYAFEELIAEFGSAFLCGWLGLANEPRPDHAQYLQGWLNCLKGDKRALFTAASKAQAAVDFLTKKNGQEVVEEPTGK
jgi:antirestriction protein ArdC